MFVKRSDCLEMFLWNVPGRREEGLIYISSIQNIPKQASATAKNGNFANKWGAEWSHSKHAV